MITPARLAVVIPAYNEAQQLPGVLCSIPAFVEIIVVVDDASTDETAAVARAFPDRRVVVESHTENRGVGAAIEYGYARALKCGADLIAVMAGDGQMDPGELVRLAEPVIEGRADYARGNRLTRPGDWGRIPRQRLAGNLVLSLATQVASGLWGAWDSQSGYTVISRNAAEELVSLGIYPRYGCPNDMLIKLAGLGFRVVDVPVRPVYNVGERSKLRIGRTLVGIPPILIGGFLWRMRTQYVRKGAYHVPALFALAAMALVAGGAGGWRWRALSAGLVGAAVVLDGASTRGRIPPRRHRKAAEPR